MGQRTWIGLIQTRVNGKCQMHANQMDRVKLGEGGMRVACVRSLTFRSHVCRRWSSGSILATRKINSFQREILTQIRMPRAFSSRPTLIYLASHWVVCGWHVPVLDWQFLWRSHCAARVVLNLIYARSEHDMCLAAAEREGFFAPERPHIQYPNIRILITNLLEKLHCCANANKFEWQTPNIPNGLLRFGQKHDDTTRCVTIGRFHGIESSAKQQIYAQSLVPAPSPQNILEIESTAMQLAASMRRQWKRNQINFRFCALGVVRCVNRINRRFQLTGRCPGIIDYILLSKLSRRTAFAIAIQ